MKVQYYNAGTGVKTTGRPARTTIIQKSEILDLRIILNTTQDVLAFLEAIN